eukprot:14405554-Ditylum_brightwellii.AAC.1
MIKKKQNQVKFVDDTSLLRNASSFGISAVQLMAQVMKDAMLWGRYLWVSGGYLEFLKTVHCLMIWGFDVMGTPRLLQENELPESNIRIESADGTKTKMR